MPRRLLPLLVLVCAAAVVGGAAGEAPRPASDAAAEAVAGPAALVRPDDAPADDPFPVRRTRATEAQLPDILKPIDAGPLVRLPRGEFEGRVRAAGRVAADAKVVPRVVDARFKAALAGTDKSGAAGGDLVGTAELDLVNPAPTPR